MGKRSTSNRSNVLSASEIGQYIYCSYAWKLRRMGYTPESPSLEPGTQVHIDFGNRLDAFESRLRSARWYAIIGLVMLVISLLLLFLGVIL
jgi:hypothetical protein